MASIGQVNKSPNLSRDSFNPSHVEQGEKKPLDPTELLPPELISEIFSYLPPKSRILCSLVNKVWKYLAEDPHLLYQDCDQLFKKLHPHYVQTASYDPGNPYTFIKNVFGNLRSLQKDLERLSPGNGKPLSLHFSADNASIHDSFQNLHTTLLANLDRHNWGWVFTLANRLGENPQTADLLLASFQNVPNSFYRFREFFFSLALQRENLGFLKLLILSESDPDLYNKFVTQSFSHFCKGGEISNVKTLLSFFSNTSLPQVCWGSVITFAARWGHYDFLQDTLRSLNSLTLDLSNAIHFAVQNGQNDCLQLLLTHSHGQENPRLFYEAMKDAIEREHLEILSLLIAFCREKSLALNDPNQILLLLKAAYKNRDIDPSYVNLILSLPNFHQTLSNNLFLSYQVASMLGLIQGIVIVKEIPKAKEISKKELITVLKLAISPSTSLVNVPPKVQAECVRLFQDFSNLSFSEEEWSDLFSYMIPPNCSKQKNNPYNLNRISLKDEELASVLDAFREFPTIEKLSSKSLAFFMEILTKQEYFASLSVLKKYLPS